MADMRYAPVRLDRDAYSILCKQKKKLEQYGRPASMSDALRSLICPLWMREDVPKIFHEVEKEGHEVIQLTATKRQEGDDDE